jgi:hypothetical protein
MTDPTDDQPAHIPDASPTVPPVRKPIAIEVAREALAEVRDLAQRLDQLATGGTVATQGGGDTCVTPLDRELLDELPKFANELAELNRKISTVAEAAGRGDDHYAQEVASLKRATQTLIERFDQLPQHVAPASVELTVDPPLIASAIVDLMRMVTEIGKNGQASADVGGFKFRRLEDAMDAVGHAMRELGLIFKTTVLHREAHRDIVNSRTWTSVYITMRYAFIHPVDMSEHWFEMVGEGRDLGDKAAGKAASYALKTALLECLMIPVNGLPDPDDEKPVIDQRPARQAQQAPPEEASQERPKMTREETVTSLANALDDLPRWPLADQRVRYANITAAAERWGVMTDPIPGQGNYPLKALIQTVAGTIPGLTTTVPQDAHDPWSDSGRVPDAENQYQ